MRRTSSLSCMMVLLLAACGGAPAAPAGSASAPPPVTNAAAPTANASEKTATAPSSSSEAPPASEKAAAPLKTPPVTKLLDAGAAPRRVLRYKVKPGSVEWVELDVATALTVTANGAPQPKTTLPTQRVLWKLEAKEVTSQGDVMVGLTVANVELLKGEQVPEPVRAQVEKDIAVARGAHGSARVSNRGIASDFAFDGIADTVDSSLLDMARVFYVALPVEEIGKGGKWETVIRLPTMGGVIDVRSVYTVTKVDADGVQAEVTSTTTAEPHQAIVMPNLPGATATLDSVSGTSKGPANVPFARLVGQTATKGNTSIALTATTPRGPVALSMATETEVSTRAGKAPKVGQK